jgi:hypothetical protein
MSELFLNRPGPIRYGWRAADRVRETAEDVARSDVAAGDALLAEEDGFVAPVERGPLSSSGSACMLTTGLFGSGVRRAGTARTARLAFPRGIIR